MAARAFPGSRGARSRADPADPRRKALPKRIRSPDARYGAVCRHARKALRPRQPAARTGRACVSTRYHAVSRSELAPGFRPASVVRRLTARDPPWHPAGSFPRERRVDLDRGGSGNRAAGGGGRLGTRIACSSLFFAWSSSCRAQKLARAKARLRDRGGRPSDESKNLDQITDFHGPPSLTRRARSDRTAARIVQ